MPRRYMIYAALLSCLSLAGCASMPSNFFVLSAPGTTGGETSQTTRRNGVSIGVGPVTLPEYLDRNEIVTRTNATSLDVSDLNRWGGGLTENFQNVLAEVLSDRLNTDRVQLHPWSISGDLTYQVLVHVNAFEARPDGQVVLDARWTVVSGRTLEVLRMGRTRIQEPIGASQSTVPGVATGPDYAQIAAAMSRSVARLGSEIARQGIR